MLIGKHVLPASQKELGFNTEDQAEEQANTVAYALYKRWGNEGLTKEALLQDPQLQRVYASVHAITSNTDSKAW